MIVAALCVASGVLFVRFGRRAAPLMVMAVLAASVAVALPAHAAPADCDPASAPATPVTTAADVPVPATTVPVTTVPSTVPPSTVPSTTTAPTTSSTAVTTTTTQAPAPPIVRSDNYKATVGVPFVFDDFLDNDDLFGLPIIEGSSQGPCVPSTVGDIIVIDFATGIISGTVLAVGVCTFVYGIETAAGFNTQQAFITIEVGPVP